MKIWIDLIVFHITHHLVLDFTQITNTKSNYVKCVVKSGNSIFMGKVLKYVELSKS